MMEECLDSRGSGGDDDAGVAIVASERVCCVGCGYALRGLAEDTTCPECGAPVAESLRATLIARTDRASRRRFAAAARLLAGSWSCSLALFVWFLVDVLLDWPMVSRWWNAVAMALFAGQEALGCAGVVGVARACGVRARGLERGAWWTLAVGLALLALWGVEVTAGGGGGSACAFGGLLMAGALLRGRVFARLVDPVSQTAEVYAGAAVGWSVDKWLKVGAGSMNVMGYTLPIALFCLFLVTLGSLLVWLVAVAALVPKLFWVARAVDG